ncbi:MAG TPA: isoprenylcysteine carboxylmethyltransferase family protein [Xanthobacteraceae bacterium]|nr:isoprenylcysteine carboxylmethyltransferase family protein [Xanthobacteraceae bacterium]
MSTVTRERAMPLAALYKSFRETKFYDFLAASPLIAWYGLCVEHQLPAFNKLIQATDFAHIDLLTAANIASKLATLLFVALLGVLLIFRHTPLSRTQGVFPRIAAIAGAYLGVAVVMLPPRELSTTFYLVATALIFGGTLFSLYSVSRLGRSISMLPEARRLVTSGPYSVIRHPLYLGEAIALMGLTLQYLSPFAVLLFLTQSMFQIIRMNNEEKILAATFPEYRGYMAHTARLVPGVY